MSAPITVLELVVSSAVGGGPLHVLDVVRHLDRASFTAIVAAPGDGPLLARFRAAGVETHRVALNRLTPATLVRVCALARRRRVRMIHSHGKGAGLYGRLAGRLLRIPCVHTFHGLHHERYGGARRRLYIGLERALSARTQTVINVSASQEREGIALGLFAAEQSVVVPNGIDVKALDALVTDGPDEIGSTAPRAAVVGTVARFDAVKGLDVLLRAIRRVPGVTLVLVGGGAEEARLRAETAALGLADRVRFLGIVDGAPRLFRDWTLFVSASRREGLPLAILEAMACRLPVVASDVAGHREVVVPETTGLLVPPDDPAALASAIARLVADPALGRRMGDAGRARVVDNFDIGPMVNALSAVYRAVAEGRRPARARLGAGHAGRLL